MMIRSRISMARHRVHRAPDRVALWVAHRLPRRLAYWVLIDQVARATTGEYGDTNVPEVTAMTVIDRAGRGRPWGS